jgi:DNA mismatch repair protein MutH
MAKSQFKTSNDYRFDAVSRLKMELREKNLFELASAQGVTVRVNGKLNKGWVGQTIEKVGNILGGNLKQPDGADFELKSVSLLKRADGWVPKETMAITSFNPESILRERFEESALWLKLSRLIVVGCYHENPERCWVKQVTPVDVSDPALIQKLEDYWYHIKDTVEVGEIANYSSKGTSKGFIQLRTKGSGKSESVCPITGNRFKTRAFYATKEFLKYVLGTM